jgi:hypothetical protein
MIFINVRQLIKKILKEEREKDLSPKIKELLQDSVVPNHKMICTVDVVAPEKMYEDPTGRDYQVMVSVVGGIGTKHWPQTQYVVRKRDEIVNDVWHTVYNYMGLSTDVFLRNVKSCDEVMSESTIPNTIKRRANQQTLKKYITNGEINYPTLCDDFKDGYEYADAIIDYAIGDFHDEFDEDIYDEDYHSDVTDYLRKLCRDEFGKYLIDIYEMTCSEEDINESEITERCWKGYTQKGMKTMFGKKYPNCVKIKKKRMNESKMLDYLKQFLSGEALEKYREEKGRKEFQKMVDMVYKITAKDNPIEGMVGVLAGSISKNKWGVSFNNPDDEGARWDFKVILKPVFTKYNPNNEPEYGERVLKFEEEFNRNARGMGFEVLSPIQHPKVNNYRVSFEWASRLNVTPID